MIISGGENVYPIEVEQLIDEHPAVVASAVIAVPDERWGEVPLAVVELHRDAELTLEGLLGSLNGHLARYKLPRGLVIVDGLPRTASERRPNQRHGASAPWPTREATGSARATP
ncbi:hypothetical protein ACC691_37335, partial [Rhizobium johnstonii]|uniref:AMP-binding enzyme n=1 Tax=Rhizobium johnstonii TaxID=3019933 RepID=UPI003F956381